MTAELVQLLMVLILLAQKENFSIIKDMSDLENRKGL